MSPRYLIEVTDGPSMYDSFSYIDTEDRLADFLFDHMKLDVKTEMEFPYEDTPYRIVLCRIPRDQRDFFLRAVDLLPALMDYVGRTDYEDCCRAFFRHADRYINGKRAAGEMIPIQ